MEGGGGAGRLPFKELALVRVKLAVLVATRHEKKKKKREVTTQSKGRNGGSTVPSRALLTSFTLRVRHGLDPGLCGCRLRAAHGGHVAGALHPQDEGQRGQDHGPGLAQARRLRRRGNYPPVFITSRRPGAIGAKGKCVKARIRPSLSLAFPWAPLFSPLALLTYPNLLLLLFVLFCFFFCSLRAQSAVQVTLSPCLVSACHLSVFHYRSLPIHHYNSLL